MVGRVAGGGGNAAGSPGFGPSDWPTGGAARRVGVRHGRQQARAFVRRQGAAVGKVNRVGPDRPWGRLVIGRTLADVRG